MSNPLPIQTTPTEIPALLTSSLILRHYLPIGTRTFWRWISSRKFPRPDMAIGEKSRFWKRETVENWIAENAMGGGK